MPYTVEPCSAISAQVNPRWCSGERDSRQPQDWVILGSSSYLRTTFTPVHSIFANSFNKNHCLFEAKLMLRWDTNISENYTNVQIFL